MTSPDGIRSDDPQGGTAPARLPSSIPGDWPTDWTVLHVVETGSTNADLMAAAAPGGAAEGRDRLALVADHQTRGRGRLDRRWEAPAGANLLVSLLLRPGTDDAEHLHRLTQRVALAAAWAYDRLAPAGSATVGLKWPNDLVVGGRKLAGVLAEAGGPGREGIGNGIDHVVVGLGLNIAWAPEDAVSLTDLWGAPPSRDDVLAAVLVAYDELATDPAELHAVYRERLVTLGQQVRADLPDGAHVTGRALDVEPDGRLVVLDECGLTHRIGAGDIVHLRPV